MDTLTTQSGENATGAARHAAASRNGQARAAALASLARQGGASATSVIEYSSRGRVAIIGAAAEAHPLAIALGPAVEPVATIDPAPAATAASQEAGAGLCLHASVAGVSGHLGAFEITLRDARGEEHPLAELVGARECAIDMILDLCDPPCIDAEIPPPGYYAPRRDAAALQQAVEEMRGLVGEYEKPRYFAYDPDICVHARNGIEVCNRCIDACPTLAIRSLGEQVAVDPYLCQGGGSCAAVCPSGAMQYIYPPLADILVRIRTLLDTYSAAGGRGPRVLFYEQEAESGLTGILAGLDESILPVAVDELGALGLEVVLPTLAYGALQVILVPGQRTAPRILGSLNAQQHLAADLLSPLGYPRECVSVTDAGALRGLAPPATPEWQPARFGAFNEKRTMLRLALEHLHVQAAQQPVSIALSTAAPFGIVEVDPQACTLCMACAAACPPRALLTGDEQPELKFIEDNCVQCGLCERLCPEHAITRRARYLFDQEQRTRARTLHEDQPFCCIRCGKPFATHRIMDQMQAKLAGHWMFQDAAALQRLQMCGDCRVQAAYTEGPGD
ncbi:MAG: 4Fe-4S binding protein [Gammaproteobacteria bacterium]|jgi:ferredoxin